MKTARTGFDDLTPIEKRALGAVVLTFGAVGFALGFTCAGFAAAFIVAVLT